MKNNYLLVSDVDGVLTDGGFYYDIPGKCMKKFGILDSDAIKFLKWNGFDIEFITSDRTGFDISEKRIKDMGCTLTYCKDIKERYNIIKYFCEEYGHDKVIFVGDEPSDGYIANKLSITFACPCCKKYALNLSRFTKYEAQCYGGNGALLNIAEWIAQYLHLSTYEEYIENNLNNV